jgi:predicted PurR-regulated permease PerM
VGFGAVRLLSKSILGAEAAFREGRQVPPSAEPTFFSPSQRRVVAASLVVLSVAVTVATIIYALSLFGRAVGFFGGVLWPLAVAGVLALVLRPVVVILERRLRLRRSAAVVLLFGLFVLVAGMGLILLLPPVIDQTIDFIAYLPTLWINATTYIEGHYPQWVALVQRQMTHPAVRHAADSAMQEFNGMFGQAIPSLRAAGGGLLDVFGFLTHLAIVPVYLFFFLLARGEADSKLRPHLPFLRTGLREDVLFLLREFVSIVESFFRGQLIIGLIMGVLLALGFTLIGLRFGLAIGLIVGLLNVIPYLGTIVGLGVTLPLAFFQPDGGWRLVGLVLLVKVIVQAIESWILTPKIMGDRTGLHPVAIIVAIFFWGTAFHGVLGMLLAIPLTAFFVTAWRLAKQKYFATPL